MVPHKAFHVLLLDTIMKEMKIKIFSRFIITFVFIIRLTKNEREKSNFSSLFGFFSFLDTLVIFHSNYKKAPAFHCTLCITYAFALIPCKFNCTAIHVQSFSHSLTIFVTSHFRYSTWKLHLVGSRKKHLSHQSRRLMYISGL